MLTKNIQIIDTYLSPLQNAHVISTGNSSTSSENGYVTVKAENENDVVKISHVSIEPVTMKFKDLESPLVLGPNMLPEATVTAKKKSSFWLWVPMIALAGLMVRGNMKQPKKVTL